MNKIFTALVCISCLNVHAEEVTQPNCSIGDTWVISETTQKNDGSSNIEDIQMTIARCAAKQFVIRQKSITNKNSMVHEVMVEQDWSIRRYIGEEKITTSKPLNFPLKIGKQWTVDYANTNAGLDREYNNTKMVYSVIGIEEVDVPAGHFTAYKIVGKGEWKAKIKATLYEKEKIVGGDNIREYWYVPSVKRWVKFVSENYNASSQLNERHVSELIDYKIQ